MATLSQPRPPPAPALGRTRPAYRLDEVERHLVVHRVRVHAAAIRAEAEAQLAALRGWPQPVRCRSGAHVGGPGCYQHADPTTAGDHLNVDPHQLHPLPFEVWAAMRPTQPTAMPLEDWATRRR